MLEPIYEELKLTADQKKVLAEMIRQVEDEKNSPYHTLEARREFACRAHALYQVLLFDDYPPKKRSRIMREAF